MLISTSFLSSDNYPRDLKALNVTNSDFIHVDVMDGKFVKQKSLPFREMKKIGRFTTKRLDVHLMVAKPKKMIKKYVTLNTEYITVHLENEESIEEELDLIHQYGVKAGLSLAPETPVDLLEPYLDQVDLILLMAVVPGEGGQAFLKDTTKRLKQLKKMIQKKNPSVLISVDGGINQETKKFVKEADILVSGSYIIKSSDFQEKITSLR